MEVISNVRVDHLGLVAGFAKEMKLADRIDALVGVHPDEKVTVGESVVAMIINGLGFTDRPISLVPQFFENIPLDLLFREGVTHEDFNRFKLSRALDKIAEFGCEALFGQVALESAKDFGVTRDALHFDTTSFSLTGEHLSDADEVAITVTKGYSKDHRPDLNQIVQELGCLSDGGVPLFMKMWNGNESDNKIFNDRAAELAKHVRESDAAKAIVADSKFYSSGNSENMALLPFITRAPETIKSVKSTIDKALDDPLKWHHACDKRDYQVFEVDELGIKQKWIVVFSKAAEERAEGTIDKRLKREKEKIEKALYHLQAQRFGCREDAQKELNRVIKGWKLHMVTRANFKEHKKYPARGRPSQGETPSSVEYQVIVEFECNNEKVSRDKQRSQCYVLAAHSELVTLSPEDIILTYSAQQNVERGFRFLKDPHFFTSSLLIKSPRRLEALVTVMTLALLLYCYAQRRLRGELAKTNETLPNQINQPTQSPTLRWVFQMLQGISCITMRTSEGIQIIWTGLNEKRLKILSLFSHYVGSIYQISSA